MASPADVVRMINKVNRPSVLRIDIITSWVLKMTLATLID